MAYPNLSLGAASKAVNTIAVGADYKNTSSTHNGKVYVYDWNDTSSNWDESTLENPTPSSSEYFGSSVSFDGDDTLLIGARRDDTYVDTDTGSVYLCTRSSGSWSMEQYVPSDLADEDYFGCAVSLDADHMVVGASKKDHSDPSVTNCGAVYFIDILTADLNRDGWVKFEDFAILGGQWRQAPGSPSADIAPVGGDNTVNELDLAIIVEQWLK